MSFWKKLVCKRVLDNYIFWSEMVSGFGEHLYVMVRGCHFGKSWYVKLGNGVGWMGGTSSHETLLSTPSPRRASI